ncbi:MAG TPA: ABC transporter permease [Rhodanobacteraceae bacterium]|nr:ABC transporter permease [Rhodanobacteraceae bacterium]
MLQHLISDVRYGVRSLLARPGFFVAAILTLALGIGANAAVFSVINTLLLKPLPYRDSERLVDIYNSYPGNGLPIAGVSVPDYLDRRAQAAALEDAALFTQRSFNLAEQGTTPQRLTGVVTTPSLFSTLGVTAARGRVLADTDASAGNEHVAVLSSTLWTNQFAADPNIVGRDVRLNGDKYRIVGVMPDGFAFPDRHAELWTPFVFTDKQRSDDERGHEFSGMVGRLKPDATLAQVDAQMDTIIHRNVERALGGPRGEGWKRFVESSGFSGRARGLRDAYVGDLRPTLWLLQALVACVLLIACANVANLVLTRLSTRQKEMSVRSALGAGRLRIARQLLVENLLLSLAGGVIGLALAYVGVALIRKLGLGGPADTFPITIDNSVLLFSLGLAVVTGLIFGSVPALALTHGRSAVALKEGGRGNAPGPAARALRNALVVVQTATAVALLGVAGLLIRSFVHVQEQSPGFSSENVLSATIDLPEQRYRDGAGQAQFYERLLGEVRSLPGVTSAGLVNNMPFSGNDGSGNYQIEGIDAKSGTFPHGYSQMIDEDFFKTMQIPVMQGRSFAPSDTSAAQRVAIVDEILVRKYFPGQSAIGKRIAVDYDVTDSAKTKWLTIVGVVGTVKRDHLSELPTKETVYVYYKQYPEAYATLALRTQLAPSTLVAPLRAALGRVDAEQPVFDILTMSERIQISLDDRRTPMLLLILFAVVALSLSAVGIYGVLAFAVALRTGEIGVRLSLGAQRRDILRLVLGDGGRLTAIGLGLGVVGAIAIGLAVRAQLVGVEVFDPLTLAIVVVLIAGTALLACWLPARRASRVQPNVALRYE